MNMYVTTKQDLCDNIIERWRKQYYHTSKFPHVIPSLIQLKTDGNLTEDTIAKVIGNRSWTRLECSCCGNDSQSVINLVDEYDAVYSLCNDCIVKINDIKPNSKEGN